MRDDSKSFTQHHTPRQIRFPKRKVNWGADLIHRRFKRKI